MVNYISMTKLSNEITNLVDRKTKSYYFILANDDEDEARQISVKGKPNMTFIIVREDKWQQEVPQEIPNEIA